LIKYNPFNAFFKLFLSSSYIFHAGTAAIAPRFARCVVNRLVNRPFQAQKRRYPEPFISGITMQARGVLQPVGISAPDAWAARLSSTCRTFPISIQKTSGSVRKAAAAADQQENA